MAFIKAENLGYDYPRYDEDGNVSGMTHAVIDVELDVEPGQFIAILGHNGSGKSTLAKHINALLTPTDGSIWIDGMNTKDEDKTLAIRQEAGMVFQNPDNQIVAAIVEEDVGFGPENLGVPTEEIWKRVEKALAATGMGAFRKNSPNNLSGGQKQRVAIAGVLAIQPQCIVLDEPTAMLDPNGRDEVMDTLHKLNREMGITVVLITHYMEEAVTADRVIVMDGGRVSGFDTPENLLKTNAIYREVYETQTSGGGDFDVKGGDL